MKKTPKITLALIMTFNPCQSGLNNLNQHYPNYEGTMEHFLKLEHIPYRDKIWLAAKVLDIKILQQWSVDCAENVLDIFESRRPGDNRVRNCIEVTKKYLLGEASIEEVRTARSAAAYAAAADADAYVAYAADADAAYADAAAAYAAYAAAADAAAYAAYAAYADAAAYAAADARQQARNEQEDINLSLLIALV